MNTKYFGDITIKKDEIIYFPTGLFGFEDKREFIILGFMDDNGESSDDFLLCLQSIEDPQLAFIMMNPYYSYPDYNPYQIAEKQLKEISIEETTKHTIYCIAVVKDDFKESTINLKCPILINVEKKLAKQVILEDSDYSMRSPVFKEV